MHFQQSNIGDFHIGQTDSTDEDKQQILLICEASRLNVFYDLKQLFYNLVDYMRAREGVDINLHVMVPTQGEVNPAFMDGVHDYVEKKGISGVVISHELLSYYLGGDSVYSFVNYVLPPRLNKRDSLFHLPKNDFDCPLVHTVFSGIWLRDGKDIKNQSSGVNLLGYVMHALKFVALNRNEVDIRYLANQRKYPVKPKIVQTLDEFEDLMDILWEAKYVAVDTEGANLNKLKNTLLTIQFCVAANNKAGQNLWVLPIEHKETPWSGGDLRYIKQELRKWMTNKSRNKLLIYQNAKFDLVQFINQLDIQWFETPVYDTTAGVFSLDENTRYLKLLGIKPYALENIEARAGFHRPPELVISKDDRGNMASFSLQEIAEYGSYDVLTIFHIALQQMRAARERNYQQWDTMVSKQIGNMIVMFAFMEARGILVDKQYLQQLASPIGPLAERIQEVVRKFESSKAAKRANDILLQEKHNIRSGDGLFANKQEPFIFSIRNTDSLQTLFFDVLGLEPLNERKNGGGSVDKKFQKQYKDNKLVALYTKYNTLRKLKSAFADGILKVLVNSADALADGRIRNSYWFISVLTGRSSATDPNMQQIPERSVDAKIIKQQFIAKYGAIFVKPDFSAHEIRVTGLVAQDRVIKKTFDIANSAIHDLRIAGDNFLEEAREAYRKNGDIHILNVRFFYNKEVDSEDPLRQDVKVTVFQTIYGAQAASLGRQIGKSTDEAQALMDTLFETWPEAKDMMDDLQRTGAKQLRVFSPLGRPRHLWAYLHPDKYVQYAMNRRAPNSVVQGCASDIGYDAAYLIQKEIYNTFLRHGLAFDGRLQLMVHDSFTNEVSLRYAPIMMYIQEHGMTTLVMEYLENTFGFKINIPFGFDMKLGLNEGAMKKWSEMRYDAAEKLFREFAKEGDAGHAEQLDDALYNLERMWSVREKEIRDNPYEMRLRGKTKWWANNMRGLR